MIRAAIVLVVGFTVLCGLVYPLAVTGISQLTMPDRANGSRVDGGSRLIGQDFSARDDLFQSRPSVTGYRPDATFFNNRGPNQASLAVQQRRLALDYARREGIPLDRVPADAATTSASGVDPHISLANARMQSRRVGRMRGLDQARLRALIDDATDGRGIGVLGEPGVNVLELNLALERLR